MGHAPRGFPQWQLDLLFRHRGALALLLATPLWIHGAPTLQSWAAGLVAVMLGLTGRLWAIRHIGGAARTRDSRTPETRVRSGPYRWTNHPLYLCNMLMFMGLTLQLRPALPIAVAGLTGAALLWGLLAARESPVSLLPTSTQAVLPWRRALRIERSTLGPWLVAESWWLAQVCDGWESSPGSEGVG